MQDESYCQVPVWKRQGQVGWALVDAEDLERVGKWRWGVSSHGYVRTNLPNQAGGLYLHRLIMDCRAGDRVSVDHINHDKFDNRKRNLRLGGQALNMQNVVRPGGTSRFRGVRLHKNGAWIARATLNGSERHLGSFASEVEAAQAAEAFRQQHMSWAMPDPELDKALRPDPVTVAAGAMRGRREQAEAVVSALRDAGWIAA